MPIGGSATEFNITGAKLKVSGGVQVTGSIVYTTDATGFGGVTAQIDNNNTLNVTSGKLTGVTKIERSTAATITAITHTNVNNKYDDSSCVEEYIHGKRYFYNSRNICE